MAHQKTKRAFQESLNSMQLDLKATAKKVGRSTIDKARSYHDALFHARRVSLQRLSFLPFVSLLNLSILFLAFGLLSVHTPVQAHYESRQAAVAFERASTAYQKAKQKVSPDRDNFLSLAGLKTRLPHTLFLPFLRYRKQRNDSSLAPSLMTSYSEF